MERSLNPRHTKSLGNLKHLFGTLFLYLRLFFIQFVHLIKSSDGTSMIWNYMHKISLSGIDQKSVDCNSTVCIFQNN